MKEIQRQIEEEPLVTSCATGDYLKNSPNLNNNNKITDIDSITKTRIKKKNTNMLPKFVDK